MKIFTFIYPLPLSRYICTQTTSARPTLIGNVMLFCRLKGFMSKNQFSIFYAILEQNINSNEGGYLRLTQ
jgi:hypothetical protein